MQNRGAQRKKRDRTVSCDLKGVLVGVGGKEGEGLEDHNLLDVVGEVECDGSKN